MSIFKNKNAILATLLIPLLFACGPSPEEVAEQERLAEEAKQAELKQRNDLATVTCNFMAESRKMDAAMRIKEINSARERLGEELYLGTDSGIKEAMTYGLCNELVLNDPEFSSKLIIIMEAVEEQKRLAEERSRIAREKAAEEARIAREKAAEEARIAAEKKAIEDKKNITIWSNNFNSVLMEYPLDIRLTRIEFIRDRSGERIRYAYTCKNLQGLTHDVIFKFKNNLGELRARGNGTGRCPFPYGELINKQYSTSPEFPLRVVDLFYRDKPATKEVLESVHIELTRKVDWSEYKMNSIHEDYRVREEIEKKIDPKAYNLPPGSMLDPTIVKTKYQIYP